jgi:hypothetical protein
MWGEAWDKRALHMPQVVFISVDQGSQEMKRSQFQILNPFTGAQYRR